MPLKWNDLLVEAGQQQPELFLEEFAILVGVEQRRTERLHLTGVIAAADTQHHAAVGDDIGHGVVLGHADRVPHRQDVKGAAELQPLGLGGEPEPELDQVWEDLVALALEMMLRGPQRLEAKLVHELGDITRSEEGLAQPLIGIEPVVRRSTGKADIVELDLPDIENVKFLDHVFLPRRIPKRLCGGVNNIMKRARQHPWS